VKAATTLADTGPQPTKAKRKWAVSHAMRAVAGLFGNTPTVARNSYVDLRVIDAYDDSITIAGDRDDAEEAVLDLLANG
jgi:DNA topoisomerase IB